jgi:ankyrin repeat protein
MERVKELICSDPDMDNAFSADGFSPLGLAAYFGKDGGSTVSARP